MELLTGRKRFGSENRSGFEFRESIIIKKLILCNVVRQASRETSGQYLDRRMSVIVWVKAPLYKIENNNKSHVEFRVFDVDPDFHPVAAVHEMCDMEIISTSTVCVCKTDNRRNRSPGEFGEQKWVHRTRGVKIMEVEQLYVIKFFCDDFSRGGRNIARLLKSLIHPALYDTFNFVSIYLPFTFYRASQCVLI
jgi:hypothetical protein